MRRLVMEQSHSHSPKEGLPCQDSGEAWPRGHAGVGPQDVRGVLRARRALMEGQEFEAEAVTFSLRSHLQRI